MQRRRPLIKKALRQALVDMAPMLDHLRGELNEKKGKRAETYVVSGTCLLSPEQSRLNVDLKIHKVDGQNKWYKNNEMTVKERQKIYQKKLYNKRKRK